MAFSWATKRKIFYFLILFIAIIIALFILIWPSLNKAPTCVDNKQNGDESGIDCGGSCQKVCTPEALQLVTLWARAFEVVPGKYNVMAYVENQNRESGVPIINYEFKLYDDNNIFIGRRDGSTFITSNDRTAIFEPGIDTGSRIPARVSFEFTTLPTWIKVDRNQRDSLAVGAEDKVLSNPFSKPKLEANIVNKTLNKLKNVDVYAVLYDESGNVMAVSKTLIDTLDKTSKAGVVFTWPNPLPKQPTVIDIFPQINIFSLSTEK
jgi:hypothetical protein